MRAILYPSEISGRVAAPPSKSMAHRALICAALAKGESRVLNLSASQDITQRLPPCACWVRPRRIWTRRSAGAAPRRLCPLER